MTKSPGFAPLALAPVTFNNEPPVLVTINDVLRVCPTVVGVTAGAEKTAMGAFETVPTRLRVWGLFGALVGTDTVAVLVPAAPPEGVNVTPTVQKLVFAAH